jgi:hypothetical protein
LCEQEEGSREKNMTGNAELERFKATLNLAEVARSYGYAVDRRESSRSSLVMRHTDGDKIVVATAEDGHGVFFSVRTGQSGSVLDFVMYRTGGNLGHARRALRDYDPFSFPTAQGPIPKPRSVTRDRAALAAQWHGFRPYQGGYLGSRGLTAATVAAAAERIRCDERGNVVFRHDDRDGLTGWEIKNRGFSGFSGGGKKALFALRVDVPPKVAPPCVVVAESAIDALSYYQHNPEPALLLSFAGGMSPEQQALLRDVLGRYPAALVLSATDNDDQGETFAAGLSAIRPDVVRARPPVGKDWNETLSFGPRMV